MKLEKVKTNREVNEIFGENGFSKATLKINGTLRSEYEKLHGVKHGLYKGFHENGKQSHEYYYTHGQRNGPLKYWNPNGILITRTNFKKGFIDGMSITFIDSEQLILGSVARGVFKTVKKGLRHGVKIDFDSDETKPNFTWLDYEFLFV